MRLYKYLPQNYLDETINEGRFLFRSLAYFHNYQDNDARRDTQEGQWPHQQKPESRITPKLDTQSVYIYSTSKALSPELAHEFETNICIEFTHLEPIVSRLKQAIIERDSIKPNRLYHRDVNYYKEHETPPDDWHIPTTLANSKRDKFARQKEYRLSFSTNNALATQTNNTPLPNPLPQAVPLTIGNIERWCRVHHF